MPLKPLGPVIFPGSFDPLTNGHIDVITRALNMFECVVVALLANAQKKSLFSMEERTALIREEFKSWGERVRVMSFSGLLVDFARQNGARVVIRGLRAITDYEYEAQMALMNKNLYADSETIFLVSREKNSYVSSTLVKQVAELGGDVSAIVPAGVVQALKRKFSKE